MPEKEYSLNIPNWDSLSIIVYEKIYDEAKNRFEDILEESQTITKRAITIFSLMIALAGYLISKFEYSNIDYIISFVIFLLLCASIFLMAPKGVLRKGTSSQTLITNDLVNEKEEIMQQRIFYCLQLQTYFIRTERMKDLNKKRINILFYSGVLIIFLLFLLLIKFT